MTKKGDDNVASEYGIKIKNIKVGSLYDYNLGVRDNYEYTKAMFTNSLFLDFLLDNGLKTEKGWTKDIICLDFDYGSRSYEKERDHLIKMIENKDGKYSEESIQYFKELLKKAKVNKDLFNEQSHEDIRNTYYKDGVNIKYISKKKNDEIKKVEKIHYKMLYRSTGKAKKGSCMFICDRLYKKAYNFLYMGIKLPKKDAPIVEASAYVSLVTSTIVDRIKINPKNILILKDIDSYFSTNVVSVETDDKKHCIAKEINGYKLKNTMFDGQAIIDESIFPKWANGYILLRHHMCKKAGFKGRIQKFYKDQFGEDYNNAKVYDMWGNEHYAKDIECITTNNAMKWIKFGITYDYWCDKVYENRCMFGIVKTAHKSKLGNVQKMSYQMVNSLDLDIMENVVEKSKQYIELMKQDNNIFLQYLRDNKNFSNDYEALVELCEQNWDFTRSEYFRERKYRIIRSYIEKFRMGKIIQDADNLVIVGSPYAMLLHSIGKDVEEDKTFCKEENAIQCFTTRFKDGQYLAEFRSPFNSKNNMGYLHNVYSENLFKYFDLGEQIIAVNMINTDFQDRNNGSDMDSDSIYTTSQEDIVEYAKYCYINYPTIVNNIPKQTKKYDNEMSNYALIDNNLARAQRVIGESSNLAQLDLTYTYNFDDKKYKDYVCILSVLAQVAIDNAKRQFDIDLVDEIDRIKKDMDIKENGYPIFWKLIKENKNKIKFPNNKINKKLNCPMNYLTELKLQDFRDKDSTLPMSYFFNKFELEKDRRTCKKVEDLIQKYSLQLYGNSKEETEDYLLLRADFDELIDEIKKIYISSSYLGLMSWLIDRSFIITPNIISNNYTIKTKLDYNKSILLQTLYNINSKNLLKCLSKNA